MRKGETSQAIFWVLLLIALLLIIVNAPILDTSKKYFYYVFGVLFLFTPVLILKNY